MTPLRGRALAAIGFLTLLAGCLTEAPGAEDARPIGGALPGRPALLDPVFLAPVQVGVAGGAVEPNIAISASGAMYVTTPLYFWRSADGKTWEVLGDDACSARILQQEPPVCPPGSEQKRPNIQGGGDGDLAVDGAGVLYWVGLLGPDASIPFQRSTDRGETWSAPFDVAEGNQTDRQWLDVLPDGTVMVTWRDFGADSGSATDTSGPWRLKFRKSLDGGETWGPIVDIAQDRLQGPLVHAPADAAVLYTPFVDAGIHVARSIDAGTTWETRRVVEIERDLTLRQNNPTWIFPVAAVDDAGTVYVVWADDPPESSLGGAKEAAVARVNLAVSKDRGETWSEPVVLSPEGKHAIFPWIVAGKPGRVAVAWYENSRGLPGESVPDEWNVRMRVSVDADAEAPTWKDGLLNDAPIHLGAVCSDGGFCFAKGKDRSMLDFFEVAITPQGLPVAVWASDPEPGSRRMRVHFGGVAEGTPLL